MIGTPDRRPDGAPRLHARPDFLAPFLQPRSGWYSDRRPLYSSARRRSKTLRAVLVAACCETVLRGELQARPLCRAEHDEVGRRRPQRREEACGEAIRIRRGTDGALPRRAHHTAHLARCAELSPAAVSPQSSAIAVRSGPSHGRPVSTALHVANGYRKSTRWTLAQWSALRWTSAQCPPRWAPAPRTRGVERRTTANANVPTSVTERCGYWRLHWISPLPALAPRRTGDGE